MIPGLRKAPGEGKVYSLQYSRPVLVVQTVKNPAAVQEPWIRSLGWDDPLEEGMAPTLGEFPGTDEAGRLQSMQSQRVGHD